MLTRARRIDYRPFFASPYKCYEIKVEKLSQFVRNEHMTPNQIAIINGLLNGTIENVFHNICCHFDTYPRERAWDMIQEILKNKRHCSKISMRGYTIISTNN